MSIGPSDGTVGESTLRADDADTSPVPVDDAAESEPCANAASDALPLAFSMESTTNDDEPADVPAGVVADGVYDGAGVVVVGAHEDVDEVDGVYDDVEEDGVYDGASNEDGVSEAVEKADGVYDEVEAVEESAGAYEVVEDDGVYEGGVYDDVAESDGVYDAGAAVDAASVDGAENGEVYAAVDAGCAEDWADAAVGAGVEMGGIDAKSGVHEAVSVALGSSAVEAEPLPAPDADDVGSGANDGGMDCAAVWAGVTDGSGVDCTGPGVDATEVAAASAGAVKIACSALLNASKSLEELDDGAYDCGMAEVAAALAWVSGNSEATVDAPAADAEAAAFRCPPSSFT